MFTQAGFFLLDALIGFFTYALLLRFYMQVFRVSFRNQVGAFIMQLTNWLVMPLRRVLPGVFGLDLASLLPAMLLQALVATAFLSLSALPVDPSLFALLIARQALLGTLRLVIYLLIGALISIWGSIRGHGGGKGKAAQAEPAAETGEAAPPEPA